MTSGRDRRAQGGDTGATGGDVRSSSPSGRARRPRPTDRGTTSTGGRQATDRDRRGSPTRGRSTSTEVAAPRGGGQLSRSTLWSDDEAPDGPQPLKASWDPVPPPGSDPRKPSRPRTDQPRRRRSAIGWFVHHYGWRAYALPVLAALTVVAIVQLVGSNGTGSASPASASNGSGDPVTVTVGTSVPTTVTVEQPGPTMTTVQTQVVQSAQTGQTVPNLTAADPNGAFKGIAAGVLPPGAPFAKTGAGTFHVVPGKTTTMGHGPKHRTFTVEVEDGIENTAKDKLFADAVVAILSDPRSWIGGGQFTLKRISHGDPDFRISLTSQMTVRKPQNCGWQIQLEASCYNRLDKRVFINDARWVRGAVVYNGDLGSYRVYATNHEVGHALGFHHQPCPKNGGLAPVMMQQSWSTSDDDLATLNDGGPVHADGKVCKVNPFPYPRGPVDGTATSGTSSTSSTSSSTSPSTSSSAGDG